MLHANSMMFGFSPCKNIFFLFLLLSNLSLFAFDLYYFVLVHAELIHIRIYSCDINDT